jgi:hypothetical protein
MNNFNYNALVGYSGFVGSNIQRLFPAKFTELYNSKNFKDAAGKSFDLFLFTASRAEKWLANKFPEQDAAHIEELISVLKTISAKKAVLISTIDVYKDLLELDENAVPPIEGHHAYGTNRRKLELFFTQQFKDLHIARLPGTFGKGLKKNAIYDLINNNEVQKIDSRGSFQFYNLEHIGSDLTKIIQNNISLINLTSEPVNISEISEYCFGKPFKNEVSPTPANYNLKSKHARLWNHNNGYLYPKEQVLEEIKQFVQEFKK